MRRILVLSSILLLAGFQKVEREGPIGESVFAWWAANEVYFVGTVVEEREGKTLVVFEDGEQAWVNTRDQIKRLDVVVGSEVMARWTDGRYYPGRVSRIVGRALFIDYDDGDKGWTSWAGIAAH